MARPRRRVGNLPAETTSFIGRRKELAELRKKLATARLVSLVGPGGVGKTRLAIRAATDLGRGFAGGAWLVELADVRDPALVGNAVAAALDLRDQAATEPVDLILSYMRDKRLLLVLDNCEHLLPSAARLAGDIVRTAPGVSVLATSREPLNMPGEHVVPVPPLELPSARESLAQLRQNEAVLLFTERAAAATGGFELTPANHAAVAELCRRLDGVPLAIELAAVRTRVLDVKQILERLTDRFGLLTGGGRGALPRHQTLRTTIDWSYDLLTEQERTLFRRLCVFAGRFTLEDVEAVCLSPGLDALASLVDRSMVTKEDARGQAAYRLHETMREYASLKLQEAGEVDELGERCTDYFWSRGNAPAFEARYRLVDWLVWVELEIDNLRGVLRHCLARGDFSRGVDIVISLSWFWFTRATTEGVWWMDQLLARGEGIPANLAWAYFMRGFLAVLQGNPEAALPWLDRAIATSRDARQPLQLAHSLALASIAAGMAGDVAGARRLLDEATLATTGLGDVTAMLSVLQARALNGLLEGDLEAVRAAASEGARIGRESGDLYSFEMMQVNLGMLSVAAGDLDEARPLLAEALGIAGRIDDRIAMYASLDALAYLAASTGKARLAAQLLGAAETVRASAGATLQPYMAPMLAQAEASASAALGTARFEAELAAGKAMSRDAAVALALGERPAITLASSAPRGDGFLGRREAEVARLVAEGLSNKQIGARLFISERTVATHVGNILDKLGFNSRAQIAAWMAAADQPA